jgi:hypothetical protein
VSAFENTPYVPLWERYSQAPQGYEDHWYIHYYPIAILANAIIDQTPLLIDTDADFYWRALMTNTPKQFLIRFWDPWGNMLANRRDIQEEVAHNIQPAVFFPEILCPRGSTVKLDITEYTGVNGTIEIALIGVKRYKAEA